MTEDEQDALFRKINHIGDDVAATRAMVDSFLTMLQAEAAHDATAVEAARQKLVEIMRPPRIGQ